MSLDLLEETLNHFKEGAKSVRAYAPEETYIITRASDLDYWVTIDEPPYQKTRTNLLNDYFKEVFGIQATY
jgi:hypothetical protein